MKGWEGPNAKVKKNFQGDGWDAKGHGRAIENHTIATMSNFAD